METREQNLNYATSIITNLAPAREIENEEKVGKIKKIYKDRKDIEKEIRILEKEIRKLAEELNFEKAIAKRDEMKALKELLLEL